MPLKNISVTVILKEKSVSVYKILKGATVAEAVTEMNRHRIGPVINPRLNYIAH